MTGFSSFVVVLAMFAGLAVGLLTFVLLGVIVSLRYAHSRQRRWREELAVRWRAKMTRALIEVPSSAPKLTKAEAQEVLPQWAYFHEFLRGECKDNLNRFAYLSGIDIYAKRKLRSDRVRQRLIAIQVLGSLRDRESRKLLRPIAVDPNPYLSLAAGHALLRIDPRDAIDEIVPMIASRPDWPPAKVLAMLREAGPEVVSAPLARATLEADVAYQPLLVIYLGTCDEEVAIRTIKKLLLAADDEQVLVTALYQLAKMAHPEGLKVLRVYLEHPNWLIQLHAVTGIGRMGNEQDIDDLVRMLRHRQYWVRYRAAEALTRVPTMTDERLVEIRSKQTDPYARDILTEFIGWEEAAAA